MFSPGATTLGEFDVNDGSGMIPFDTDYSFPIYFSTDLDPAVTIRCTDYGGGCPASGMIVHVPVGARPQQSNDGHIVIIEWAHNLEFDLWQANGGSVGVMPTSGTLTVSWGGVGPATGDGVNRGSYASTGGNDAVWPAMIREQDMEHRQINHAFFLAVTCANSFQYPSTSSSGAFTSGCPQYGARIWLDDAGYAAILAARPPAQLLGIYDAWHKYGAQIDDTGTGGSVNFALESDLSYTTYGAPGPWATLARSLGLQTDGNHTYHIPINAYGVDLAQHLHVLAACVNTGSC